MKMAPISPKVNLMRYRITCLGILFASMAGCALAEGEKTLLLPVAGEDASIAQAIPGDADPYEQQLTQGRALESRGQWEQARTLYRDMIASYPERYEPYHRLGIVADHQGNYREAQNLFGEALRLSSANPDIFGDLGYSFYLQGELIKAESAMLKAVQLAPGNPRYLNNLGLVLGQLGRHDEALAVFRQVGREADAQYNLAFIYASQDRPELALACFEQALQADPQHQAAREALASFRDSATGSVARIDGAPARVGYVPYQEDGETAPDLSTTLAPRSSRIVRSARTATFDDATSVPPTNGGQLTTSAIPAQ